MNTFRLKIVTPDGLKFAGMAQKLVVRTVSGDVAIMARHVNYVAPLGMGEAAVYTENGVRYGACIGGMLSVMDGEVSLVPMTFEWAEEIDVARAEASKKRAEQLLAQQHAEDREILLAKARLRRALVRQSTASRQ